MLVPKSILSLRKFSDVECSRFALGGMKLTRLPNGAPLAIATDGRRLSFATWKEPPASKFPAPEGFDVSPNAEFCANLPAKEIEKLERVKMRKIKGKPELESIAIDEHGEPGKPVRAFVTDVESSQSFAIRELEGRYPRVDEIIPKYQRPVSIKLNAEYLAEAAQISAKITGVPSGYSESTLILTIDADAPNNSPLVITADGPNGSFAHALMPLPMGKSKENTLPVPAWLPFSDVSTWEAYQYGKQPSDLESRLAIKSEAVSRLSAELDTANAKIESLSTELARAKTQIAFYSQQADAFREAAESAPGEWKEKWEASQREAGSAIGRAEQAEKHAAGLKEAFAQLLAENEKLKAAQAAAAAPSPAVEIPSVPPPSPVSKRSRKPKAAPLAPVESEAAPPSPSVPMVAPAFAAVSRNFAGPRDSVDHALAASLQFVYHVA